MFALIEAQSLQFVDVVRCDIAPHAIYEMQASNPGLVVLQ
jgi:hypothetical protein